MKISLKRIGFIILPAVVAAGWILVDGGISGNAFACSYYASPSGGGNGSSPSSPFRIPDFWRVAGPGNTLCLLDGVYTDRINPPQHLNGSASARITIRALNDGQVRIDGGRSRIPVELKNNDFFLLEGFNAANSSDTVVLIGSGSDYNIVRRVCAWNAPDNTNSVVWGIHGNRGNLLEDVCGFGTGRKIFSSSQGGNELTIRRAWGRWERSLEVGPKMVYSLVYNNANTIYENVIGTWDESAMGGTPVNQPYGILSMDTTEKGACTNSRYLGSIGYLRARDNARTMIAVARSNNDSDCLTFQDVVAYIEPGSHLNIRPFYLRDSTTSRGKYATNATAIGGDKAIFESQWRVTNPLIINSPERPNIWNGTGARVCKRYVSGRLTSEPLWPWPMNQRIIEATEQAGKTAVDVTKTMEEMFGPIPSECRTGSSSGSPVAVPPPTASTPVPATPGNLIIAQ